MPLAGLCALYLVCGGCSSAQEPAASSSAGAPAGGTTAQAGAATAGASASASTGNAGSATTAGSGGAKPSEEPTITAGNAGENAGPPPAIDGRSIYAQQCHGDSKDCNLATVPCFGVGSQTPNVAAGWACANRCNSNADCSDAPSGAEARASCVPFTSTGHCVLVCQNENQAFACPDGMSCFVPEKSPLGYCLWR